MEVWLLETSYIGGPEFEEIFLHISGTDIWLTAPAEYNLNYIEGIQFTKKFWKDKDNEHLFTYLGEL